MFDELIDNSVSKSVLGLGEKFQSFFDVLNRRMTELLRQVTERGASGSPEFNLCQSCGSDPLSLKFLLDSFLDGDCP